MMKMLLARLTELQEAMHMFIRLGIVNIQRQLARSLLVLATLALAAISLTYSLFVQDIAPLRVAPLLSKVTGGEILVAPLRWAGQTSDITGDANYRYARLVASGSSWLEWFYPELYEQGFWVRADITPSEFFNREDVEALAAFPGVTELVVTPMLPALVHAVGERGVVEYPVRLCPMADRLSGYISGDFNLDKGATSPYILLNSQMQTTTAPRYNEGQTVRLILPQQDAAGGLDFANAQAQELPFASYIEIPSRPVAWNGPGEQAWESAPSLQMETGVFKANMAWVPESTWQELLQVTGSGDSLPLSNVVLHVDDLQQLDEVIVRLSNAFPHLTFVHMSHLEEHVYLTGSMEYFRRAPREVWMRAEQSGLVVPQSFSPVFSILFLLIAGLLLAGHMLTGAAARRKEIGMLRALGARQRDVLILGVSETGCLTFIGVTAGFVALRLLGMIMELRGGQKLLQVLGRVTIEYVQVLGISLGVSLIFALLPIWRLSQITPMEVLRHG